MAVKKVKKTIKENISLELRFPKYVGYADYFLNTPVSMQIKNALAEAVSVTVHAGSEEGLLAEYETQTEVPFESSVELNADGIFSPLFLSENDELTPCTAEVTVLTEGEEICKKRARVTALPFDWWEGIEGNAERLACFVRPKNADCSAVLADAGKRLKK